MKSIKAILFILLLYPAGIFAMTPQLPLEGSIITKGLFFLDPQELPALRHRLDSMEFYGIYPEGDMVSIRPAGRVNLRTEDMRRRVDISLPGHIKVKKRYIVNRRTGVKIECVAMRTVPQPLVFLSLPCYRQGKQASISDLRVELPVNGEYRFIFGGDDFIISHSARLHENDYPSDICITLINAGTGERQLLSMRDRMMSTRSYLVFAGDIDGDGRLDLILDESPQAHHGHLKLYLSTAAGDDRMVGLAASEENSEDPPYQIIK